MNAARGWAWIPIEQYSNSTLTIQFFEHVHNLSLQFHLNRKTGELLRILDRGTSSIVSLLSTILFQLLPVVADVAVAVWYFYRSWTWEYAVIVFVTILLYIIVTVTVTEWRTRFRRAMISFDNDARAKAVDSLLNFETVKYYSNEQFEVDRYREAIRKYMEADYKSQVTYQLLNLMQTFVITLGLMAGCLLCAYEISQGKRKVKDFVIFLTYLAQLYQPVSVTRSNQSKVECADIIYWVLTCLFFWMIVELVRYLLPHAPAELYRHGKDDPASGTEPECPGRTWS